MFFLGTNRYALRKARQEDVIKRSGYSNYTIVRPYITYSEQRLQLGVYEKEHWLYRLLKGRDIVVNKDILNKSTTLTYGYDVSKVISHLIGNKSAYGKIVQIASQETMTWEDILKLYLEIIIEEKGLLPKVYLSASMKAIDDIWEGGYNTIYDRVWNRSFDSSYVENLIGRENVKFTNIRSGLSKCLRHFLTNGTPFLDINWQNEAYQDILTGQMARDDEFSSDKERELYYQYRNTSISDINGLDQNIIELLIC